MKNTKRNVIIFFISLAAFFAFTMPFRNLFSVFTVTEVRPAAVLYPVFGVCFGVPAALGITVANLIADAASGYPMTVLLEGIPLQFLYAFIPYLMWKKYTKNDTHRYRMDSVKKVLYFAACVFVSALLAGIGVGFIVQTNFGADFVNSGIFVLLNNFIVGLVLGYPMMILLNHIISKLAGHEKELSVIEKTILITAGIEVVVTAIIIAVVYASKLTVGTYDTWNTIFIFNTIALCLIMILSLNVMIAKEKKHEQ